jgi:hypothetical protein
MQYVCPYCGVSSGVRCKTKSGKRASMMHSWRTEPLRIMWNVGYHEGIEVEKRWRDAMVEGQQ